MSTIRGSVFQDLNDNGIFDLGEGLSNATVTLNIEAIDFIDEDGNGISDNIIDENEDGIPDEQLTRVTNDNGEYTFENLPGGSFTLDQNTINGFNAPENIPRTINILQLEEDITENILNVPVNQPPIAVDDTATTDAGTPVIINVLANDTDPDNGPNPLSIDGITLPANGIAVINNNNTLDDTTDDLIDYTPNTGFSGIETFEYAITDGLDTDTATVTVTVNVEPPPAIPTTLIVTTTQDEDNSQSPDPDTGLSLREAINLANSNPDPNIIEFDPDVFDTPQTITLSLGELTVTEDLTINGLGADRITVDANSNSRVFNIDDGSSEADKQVTINGLTITGGRSPVGRGGGGISSNEPLTVTDSIISRNSAALGGGIYATGLLTVISSTISENSGGVVGGGISANNNTTVTNSTISGNSSLGSGGGISANTITLTNSIISGNLSEEMFGGGILAIDITITNSTISGNSAASNGGGISANNNITITNSTISGNFSGMKGGGIGSGYDIPDILVTNSTITLNTGRDVGGISIDSTIAPTLRNSIIAGNTDTQGSASNVSGEFVDNDNLIGIPDGLSIDDILDTELTNNGGSTATHALVPGSPAIDAGNNDIVEQNELVTDQRGDGFNRIIDGNGDGIAVVDIGAFESQEELSPGLSTLTGAVFEDANGDGVFDQGEGVENVLVFLDDNSNGLPDEEEQQTTTIFDGFYSFVNLPVDTVTLNQVLPEGFVSGNTPAEIPLIANQEVPFNILNVPQTPGLGSIQGVKFNDLDQDGIFDPENGEIRIAGVTIFLEFISENGTAIIPETIATGDNGSFLFSNLTPGTYLVREEPQPGFTRTTPVQEIIVFADDVTEFNIGNQAETGSVTGIKFQDDSPTNGILDPDTELLLSEFTIYVDLDGDGERDDNEPSGISDDGNYFISDVPIGEYVLREDLTDEQQLEFLSSLDGVPVEVTASEQPAIANIGNIPRIPETGAVAGVKFEDLNQNGIQDSNEDPLPGFTIYIDSNNDGIFNDNEPSDLTNNQGSYRFDNLEPETYIVREVPQQGFIQTSPDPEIDPTVEVIANQESTLNFGNFQEILPETGQISGTKFNDANGNGNLDPGEQGISGVTIYLDINNNQINDPNEPSIPTEPDGFYQFINLTPGSYIIREQLEPGFARTTLEQEITVSAGEVQPFDIGNVQLGSIQGIVFNDLNANSERDLSEPGLSGFEVFIDFNGNNIPDPDESVSTNPVGNYSFDNLFPGTYSVRQVNLGSFIPTLIPNPIVIESGSDAVNAVNVNFGNGLPGVLGFSQPNYRVNEEGTTDMEVMVTRTEGSVGEVNVTVVPSPGTATPGLDYDPTPQPVTFANGDTEAQSVTIPIVDDVLVEPDETIFLNLVDPTGDAILGLSATTLTINRSDVGAALNLSSIEDLEPVNTVDALTNAGVEISSNTLGIVSFQQGGSGNFTDPLNNNAITYDQQDSIIINVPNGFDQQFSFRYASPFFSNHTVTIYDQVNGQGNALATRGLPLTSDSGLTPGAYQIGAEPFPIAFVGIARSVVIGNEADQLVFNDLTFG